MQIKRKTKELFLMLTSVLFIIAQDYNPCREIYDRCFFELNEFIDIKQDRALVLQELLLFDASELENLCSRLFGVLECIKPLGCAGERPYYGNVLDFMLFMCHEGKSTKQIIDKCVKKQESRSKLLKCIQPIHQKPPCNYYQKQFECLIEVNEKKCCSSSPQTHLFYSNLVQSHLDFLVQDCEIFFQDEKVSSVCHTVTVDKCYSMLRMGSWNFLTYGNAAMTNRLCKKYKAAKSCFEIYDCFDNTTVNRINFLRHYNALEYACKELPKEMKKCYVIDGFSSDMYHCNQVEEREHNLNYCSRYKTLSNCFNNLISNHNCIEIGIYQTFYKLLFNPYLLILNSTCQI